MVIRTILYELGVRFEVEARSLPWFQPFKALT